MTRRSRTVEKSSVSSGKMCEIEIGERTERLDDLLLDMVDGAMKRVFREAGAKVIYDYMEHSSSLRREEIAEKTDVFSVDLKRLLGSGAFVIERLILKNLYSRLGLKFKEKEGHGFSDYIKELRNKCGC